MNIKLIIPATVSDGLVLNHSELLALGVAGLSYDLIHVVSHFANEDDLAKPVKLLPSPGLSILNLMNPGIRWAGESLRFSASTNGRKISLNMKSLISLLTQFHHVILPKEIVHKVGKNIDDDLKDLLLIGESVMSQCKTADIDYLYGDMPYLDWQKSPKRQVMIETSTPLLDAKKGLVYDAKDVFDITQRVNRLSLTPLSSRCGCYSCIHFTRAYFHHLYQKTPLLAIKLLSFHNVKSFLRFMFI